MALTLARANRILEKLGFPAIRDANHFEQTTNEYGEKLRWVIDQDDRQALRTYPTLNTVLAAILEQNWDTFNASVVTPQELGELRAIPSQVARLL